MEITIVGAGIAGLSTAISLTKWMQTVPQITIIELRPEPSTIGGAIGLTPNALRALHSLGVLDHIVKQKLGASVSQIELFDVYTARRLGHIDFSGPSGDGVGEPPLKGHRILRSEMLQALLVTVKKLNNVAIQYGRKLTRIEERGQQVFLSFDDESEAYADLLVGCDGIHSKVRQLLVEPGREPEYTGIAAVSGFSRLSGHDFHWRQTGLVQGQRGSFISSFFTPSNDEHYIGAIMETKAVQSREGWLAKGAEQETIKQSVLERYQSKAMPYLQTLIGSTHGWNLYPVYKLGPQGRWSTRLSILLGDAAHAMPPQGESAGIAMEDAIVFGRVMSVTNEAGLPDRFAAYERIRRPRADEAYQQATFGWETNKDCSWFQHKVRGWLTYVFLWFTAGSRVKRYSEDLATAELDLS